MNAATHLMTATKARSPEEEARIEQRTEEWQDFLKATTPHQQFQGREVVAASLRIERCRQHEDDWWTERASRAGGQTWESDRVREIAEIGKSLARDPHLTAAKLRQSYHGVKYLLAAWRAIAERLGKPAAGAGGDGPAPQALDEDQRRQACDLLGIPLERRDVRTPLDPPEGTGSGAAPAAHQAAFVQNEIAGLERLLVEELAHLDTMEKTFAAERRVGTTPRELRLIRRYQSEARRDYDRWLAALREDQERVKKAAEEDNAAVLWNAILQRKSQARSAASAAPPQPPAAAAPPPAPSTLSLPRPETKPAAPMPFDDLLATAPDPGIPTNTLPVFVTSPYVAKSADFGVSAGADMTAEEHLADTQRRFKALQDACKQRRNPPPPPKT
jgi:hypothetical protein